MIKEFNACDSEIRKFRESIFAEDLNLDISLVKDFDPNNPVTDNKFAYWYSDSKFLNNGFDKVLLFYHNGEAVGMVGGTHFNEDLYRSTQMYYILKSARKIPGLNTLHFREDGFFDWQITRAKDLGCKAVFISVDTFDRRHEIMYEAMKNDIVGPGHMPNSERKYTAKDLVYLDETYPIKHVHQKILYYPLVNDIDFHKSFYKDRDVV